MLQKLSNHAQRVGLLAESGFRIETVRWLLVFAPDGRFLGIQPLGADDRRGEGRDFVACPYLTDSELKSVIDGRRRRQFLVDTLQVVAMFAGTKSADKDTAVKHGYFLDMLDAGAEAVPVLARVAASLRHAGTRDAVHAKLIEAKAKPTEKATLAITEENGAVVIVVEQNDWHEWWRSFRANLGRRLRARRSPARPSARSRKRTASLFRCLLTGQLTEPADHYVVRGLRDVGGRGEDRLVSFDKPAFVSYSLKGGANAAMGEDAAKTYAAALEDLIKRSAYRSGGTKIVYWYSGRVKREDDPLREMFEGFGLAAPHADGNAGKSQMNARSDVRERAQAESCARRLLDAVRAGQRPELADYCYYALTLSANSGRIIVRHWMEGQFKELLESVDAWFDDMAIVNLSGLPSVTGPRFENVVTSVLRERGRTQKYEDWIKPLGSVRGALWDCAMRGHKARIPETVIQRVLLRHREAMVTEDFGSCLDRAGENIGLRRSRLYCRMGLLKSFLVRSNTGDKTMLSHLSEDLDSPCYQFGRLMAVLADLQRASLRKESGASVKSSIVDRFYIAASTTPRLVHGRLVGLSNHHLRKMAQQGDRGSRAANAIRDRIAEISVRIDPKRLPTVMPLEDQSLFALGYYHQIAQMNRDRREAYANRSEESDEPGDEAQSSVE